MANFNLGVFREAEARDDEALALYRRAAELDPRWGEPHAAAGAILARRGKLDEAGREFSSLRDGYGASPIAWRNYAAWLERVGRSEEAARIRARVTR
jgi:Flp pilus assembly protein TadD